MLKKNKAKKKIEKQYETITLKSKKKNLNI